MLRQRHSVSRFHGPGVQGRRELLRGIRLLGRRDRRGDPGVPATSTSQIAEQNIKEYFLGTVLLK